MKDIIFQSATVLAQTIRRREVTAEAVTRAFLEQIERLDHKVRAFLTVLTDQAITQAKAVDTKIAAGQPVGALAGVPVAVKDNILIRGSKTTCASKILEGFVATYDATVIAKLRQADAVFIGKTNMDEFAMGSSTEHSAFQVTRNPWNLDCIPGGSSGGSAAAVAARMAPLALGSDTGGSIRQPAGCCGVVGLKPTYGRVSRFGLVAFASSLDQIGPLAGTVADCALLLSAIAGYDVHDTTSVNQPVPPYAAALQRGIQGLKIGLPKEYFIPGVDPEVERAVHAAVKVLEQYGASVREISLPHTPYATGVYYILAPSEASANLARYDGVRYGYRSSQGNTLLALYERSRGEGFGPEVKRRIMLGTYTLSAGYYEAYYGKAQKVRTCIQQDFTQAFGQVDIIATPVAPTPAFKIGEKLADPLQMYLSDIFTISCNLAGIPGMSLPCGVSSQGLPIGLQILAKPLAEETLFQVAGTYEQATDWYTRLPPVTVHDES